MFRKSNLNNVFNIPFNELFNLIPFVIQDAVDTEIKIGGFELEKLI